MARILVVGQVPPPYHGQAIAIRAMLAGDYPGHSLVFVPMRFSRSIDSIGRFAPTKLVELLLVVARIIRARFRERPAILYYPPAGDTTTAVYRDLAVLGLTRWLFPKTVYHFHACGLLAHYQRSGPLKRACIRLAYGEPSLAIINSRYNPPDADFLGARRTVEIMYGIDDRPPVQRDPSTACPVLLMVAQLFPEKGLHDLLEALARVRERGLAFRLEVAGAFSSEAYRGEIKALLQRLGLTDAVRLLGQLTGEELLARYEAADLFCFPSYHRSESLGIVLLEAMRAGLPVVATRWRGIQSVVADGQSGFLFEPRAVPELADRLALLLEDPALRHRMGASGRERFEAYFTRQAWYERLTEAFDSLA